MGCGKGDSREIVINGTKVRLEKRGLSLYEEYEENFGPDFVILTDVPDAVKKRAKAHYRHTNYLVLMGEDINRDGMKEYFVVEPYPGVHRGIVSGIIVGEDGKIQLFMDRKRGLYGPDYMVLDFKRMGLKEGEVECIRIGFSKESIGTRLFFIQMLDEDLNVISRNKDIFLGSIYSANVVAYYDAKTGARTYGMFDLEFLPSEEEMYKLKQTTVNAYRSNRAQGIVWKYPEYEKDREVGK
jgi:hypothetical protein